MERSAPKSLAPQMRWLTCQPTLCIIPSVEPSPQVKLHSLGVNKAGQPPCLTCQPPRSDSTHSQGESHGSGLVHHLRSGAAWAPGPKQGNSMPTPCPQAGMNSATRTTHDIDIILSQSLSAGFPPLT